MPEKGCFDLLDALVYLADDARGMKVRFVGEAAPWVHDALTDRARFLKQHGIDVEIMGPCSGNERQRHYEWAHMFVFPTRYLFEGQPLVLLEALAAGLPIVTTRRTAILDTVSNGGEALLIAPGDTSELANAIRRLLADPELRRLLAQNARSLYEAKYRASRFRDDVVRLLSAAG
jgi:glycosyltransferase involved in cell wall biosynthesis